jgi:hypothetical protein
MIEYLGVKHLRYLDGLILMRQIDTSSNPVFLLLVPIKAAIVAAAIVTLSIL